MRDIVLLALPEEAPALVNHPNVFFTGLGKVNAAIVTARLIERHSPTRIINFGTAGGITVGSGLHQATRFVQRDMNCAALGYAVGCTPYDSLHIILDTGAGLTCSTGDDFVTDPVLTIPADLVDMESYAIAKACHLSNTEFVCFKYVSDQADTTASLDWQQQVSQGEQYYISKINELAIAVAV
jgi:adenosylhomocysteine nucleosidase